MAKLQILPGALDIDIFYNATLDVTTTVNYINADGSIGALFDFTGYSATMLIVRAGGSLSAPDDTLTTVNGRLTLGGTAGTIRIQSSSAQIAGYTFTLASYNLEVTSSAGIVLPMLSGAFTIKSS